MGEHRLQPDPDRDVDLYDVVDEAPPGPSLPGEVVLTATADELIDKVAAEMVVHAENCVREFGDFHLALSGGSTPEPLYRRLMYDPNYRRLPWRRTHLWIVDERCVPLDDEQSNFKMINETIGEHADIPPEQVHPIPAVSKTADTEYEETIQETLSWREKGQDRLDYVLLGMGADGHTASLFPRSDILNEANRLVRFAYSQEAVPPERVTMTFPLINSARLIAVLVTGWTKSRTIRRVVEGAESVQELPITGVAPLNGELKWYLDADAASESL